MKRRPSCFVWAWRPIPATMPFAPTTCSFFASGANISAAAAVIDDAVRLLTQAAKEQPGEKFFREAAVEVLRRWAEQ